MRWLFNIFVAISLLLPMATVALWGRSDRLNAEAYVNA